MGETEDVAVTAALARIQHFKTRSDSLRIPASRIAAVAGYHPYAVLPELFLDYIYQGRVGHELRLQDAKELRMELVSSDAVMLELAKKAGTDTAKALQSAIQVKDGRTKLANVSVAETLKKKVLDEAKKSNKLTAAEIKKLSEGTRSYVDTGFGTHHEDDALNLYEKKCGWEVRERNAAILNWPFARVDVLEELTVAPMGPATVRESRQPTCSRKKADNCEAEEGGGTDIPQSKQLNDGQTEKALGVDRTDVLHIKQPIDGPTEKAGGVDRTDTSHTQQPIDGLTEKAGGVDRTDVSHIKQSIDTPTEKAPPEEREEKEVAKDENKKKQKPFFIISGAVDGIRDELWCPPTEEKKSGIDEEWILRKVIVECKHRMRRAFASPPLYDQIQTTAYCLMYGTEEADIIQVVRKERPRKRQKQEVKKDALPVGQQRLDDFVVAKEEPKKVEGEDGRPTEEVTEKIEPKVNAKRGENKENDEPAESTASKATSERSPEESVEIVVSRVSLGDRLIMNHQRNWHSIILPRLRSFVDAVYRVRGNDELRKLLLEIIASEEQTGYATTVCWDMLHAECPWLKDCDTALHRFS